MKRAAITIIFNENKDQILLIKRKDVPVYVLPGGGIEDHESPENAAIRETFEETGFHVEILRKAAEYQPINSLSAETHLFVGKIVDGIPSTGDETDEISFFPISQLPRNFFIIHRDFLEDALNHQETVYKKLTQVTYLNLLIQFLKHPILVLQAIKARFTSKP